MRFSVALVCLVLASSVLVASASSPFQKLQQYVPKNTTIATDNLKDGSCQVGWLSGSCIDAGQCTSTPDNAAVPGYCAGADNIQCCVNQPEASPGCGTAALARALTWINVGVLYCQSANGQPDYDSSCASTCVRASNSDWDAYRSDCSGFASYAYGLGAPGRTTAGFAPYATDASYQLTDPTTLAPGDLVNSTPEEHIMIFVQWLASDFSSAQFYEEPGCSSATPYATTTNSGVTNNGDGTITLSANGMNFIPIRMFSSSPC